MHHIRVIFIILLVCTYTVHAQDHWFFGTKPAPAPKKTIPQTYICPVDPPVGYEVYAVIVSGQWCKLIGKWSESDVAQKEEVRHYFDRFGGVQGIRIKQNMIFLVCGIEDAHDSRLCEVEQHLPF